MDLSQEQSGDAGLPQKLLLKLQSLRETDSTQMSRELQDLVRVLEPQVHQIAKRICGPNSSAIDESRWQTISEEEKRSISAFAQSAMAVIDALEGVGPSDMGSIMFRTAASNSSIIFLGALGIAISVGVLALIYLSWPTQTPNSQSEASILGMIILLGCMGAMLHFGSSLAKYVGNRELQRSWILYYLLMPIEGAALAPVVYLLLRVGVLSAGSGVQNLNLYGLYAFAALTGMFSKQAIELLSELFMLIFTKVRGRDELTSRPNISSKSNLRAK